MKKFGVITLVVVVVLMSIYFIGNNIIFNLIFDAARDNNNLEKNIVAEVEEVDKDISDDTNEDGKENENIKEEENTENDSNNEVEEKNTEDKKIEEKKPEDKNTEVKNTTENTKPTSENKDKKSNETNSKETDNKSNTENDTKDDTQEDVVFSNDKIENVQDEISFKDKATAVKLVLSKLTLSDIAALRKLTEGGLTTEERVEAKRIALSRFTEEEIKIIDELYEKYLK